MEIAQYLSPADVSACIHKTGSSLYERTVFFKPGDSISLSDFNIVFLGITDDRGSDNEGSSAASLSIRKSLYNLQIHSKAFRFIDLGNVITGSSKTDTYFAIREIVTHLSNFEVFVFIFGATQDMLPSIVSNAAREKQHKKITIIDSSVDFGFVHEYSNKSYLKDIKSKLQVTHLASQAYFLSASDLENIDKSGIKLVRLGKIREDIRKTEPLVRDSFLLSFDIGAIRQCDAPGNASASPNGLYAEESCQIARYFGLSEQSRFFHLSEINPSLDFNNQTSSLGAQIIWHVIDGIISRKEDYPSAPENSLQKYIVNSVDSFQNIVFYKSFKTDRWWIEIESQNSKHIIPCNHEDYLTACNNQIPEIYIDELSRL